MDKEELKGKVDEIVNRHVDFAEWATDSSKTTEELVELINKHVSEVIGEDVPHSDNVEFIDPLTGISSKDRVKIWNECLHAIRERAGL